MTPDDVTAEWLSSVLDGPVDAVSTQRIGDGHIGMNLRVGITSPDPSVPESLVLKMPSPDPTSQATAAIADGVLYVRTLTKVFALGER